jgi:hypothetical protein
LASVLYNYQSASTQWVGNAQCEVLALVSALVLDLIQEVSNTPETWPTKKSSLAQSSAFYLKSLLGTMNDLDV